MKIIISTFVLLLRFTNSGYFLTSDLNLPNKQEIDYLSILPEEIKTEILGTITDPGACVQTIDSLGSVSKKWNTFVSQLPIQKMLEMHEITIYLESIRKKHSDPKKFIKKIIALRNKDQTFKKILTRNKRMQAKLAKEFTKAYPYPLHEAAKFGFAEVVKALIQPDNKLFLAHNKIDVNKGDTIGDTPLIWAACNGHTEVVKMLLTPKANANKANNNGETPLYWGARFGYTEMVKMLLAHKADVNKANTKGDTPLIWAACHGHTETVKALLAHNAKVNKSDSDDLTPLFWAARNGHTETLKVLLEHKADVNKTNTKGKTPLYWAARNGHTKTVKVLLEHKADVNKTGKTALIWAARKGYTDVVNLLLKAGANKNIKNKKGKTPLNYAVKKGHTDIVELLRKK